MRLFRVDNNIQGMVLFADDVRNEIHGKTSIMGLLGNDIDVSGEREITNLHCVVLINARCPRLLLEGSIEVTGVSDDYRQPGPLKLDVPIDETESATSIQIVAKIRPFELGDEPVFVKVGVSANGSPITGDLKISWVRSDSTAPASPPRRIPKRKGKVTSRRG